MRPFEVADKCGAGGAYGAVHGCCHVESAGADLERGVAVAQRLGAAHQGVLELLAGPVGVLLGEDGGRSGHVWGRHRGAELFYVHAVAGALLGAGGVDGDAGGGEVGLEPAASRQWSDAGEPGESVLFVHGADGQRAFGVAGGADGHSVVAGGDDEERVVLRGEVLHRQGHRVEDIGTRRVAEAHVDHVGAGFGGPLHAGDDPGVVADASVVEDFADDQVGCGGDAGVVAVGGGAGAGDDRGDVGAVSLWVGDVFVGDEADAVLDQVGEVGVGVVDAGVEDGDGDAVAVVAGFPGFGGADLGDAVGEGGVYLAVEPELRAAAAAFRAGLTGAGIGGEGGPEGAGVFFVGGEGVAVDGG